MPRYEKERKLRLFLSSAAIAGSVMSVSAIVVRRREGVADWIEIGVWRERAKGGRYTKFQIYLIPTPPPPATESSSLPYGLKRFAAAVSSPLPIYHPTKSSTMRYIAAYLLLQIGGNASPGAADIKKVLAAGGVDCDESRLSKLLSELKGKSIDELVATGSSKLSSVPSGGAVASGGAPAAGGAAPAAAAEIEEKKEEPKEESDDDMGFGLFD